jgi:serine/threonine protein kinase
MSARTQSQSPPPPAARASDRELDTHASAVVAAISSASLPNIPYNVLAQWTKNFSDDNLIGQGAFGKVYVAVCHDSRKPRVRLAVKWYPQQPAVATAASASAAQQSHADAVRREINVLHSFHHPNIIRLLGYSMPLDRAAAQASDTLCLVYEYAARGGLDKLLRDDGSARLLTWQLRIRIMLQIATALSFMHRRFSSPAYHRDVKSANVVITDDLVAKLIDCGLSKYVPEHGADPGFSVQVTMRDMRFGTAQYVMKLPPNQNCNILRRYMCPDYMAYGVYSATSEIFSFGLVMAELLTGHLHYDPKAPQKLKLSNQRVLRDVPSDSRAGEWPDAAVQQLKALVGRCTSSETEDRPPDMATVMRELRALLEQHCPASAAEAGDAMIAELAAAREEIARMRLDQQFQDMQRARATAPQLQCCVCAEDVAASDGCTCSGQAPGHFYCNQCFNSMVLSQVTGEGKPVFLATGCEVTCAFCLGAGIHSVFDMRLCAAHLTPAAYSTYHKTMAEPEVLREQLEWQQRMQKQQAEFTARLQHVQRAAATAAQDPHLKHIAEQLILPRCPTQSCRRHIAAFDACAGLQVALFAACRCVFVLAPPLLLMPLVAVWPPRWKTLRARAGLRCSPLRLVLPRVPRCSRLPRSRSLLPSQPQPRQRVPAPAAPAYLGRSDAEGCLPARAIVRALVMRSVAVMSVMLHA